MSFSLTLTTPATVSATVSIRSMIGSEELGRLFKYQLELYSDGTPIDVDELLGENLTVELTLDDGSTRYFNGYVSRLVKTRVEGALTFYRATLVPWLWFLTRASNNRIFQNGNTGISVPDIIMQVFDDHGFSDYDDRLSATYRTWEYSAQYRETDFNYVSRLMEQEGIYYYFTHEADKHTLVLADAISAHDAYTGYDQVVYYPPTQGGIRAEEHVFDWKVMNRVMPGTYTTKDYNFKNANTPLLNSATIDRDHPRSEFEMYDYPGEYVSSDDGDGYARVRIEEAQARHGVSKAQSNAAGLACGHTFQITGYPHHSQLPTEPTYLITSVSYALKSNNLITERTNDGETDAMKLKPFLCTLTAIDQNEQFRSARVTALPEIKGPQTAVVVDDQGSPDSNGGQKVNTDEYGRVKVRFHWDRDDENSCWIRVSQNWAGKRWGGLFIPYVGQEVIVDFLEGDPDRPVITGCLYNSAHMPKYELPENKRRSGISDAYGNELLFNGVQDTSESHYRRHGRYAGNSTGDTVEKEKVKEADFLFLNTSDNKPDALDHQLDGILDYTDANRTEVTMYNREVSIGGKSRISIGAGGLGVWDAGAAWVNNMRPVGSWGGEDGLQLWRQTVVSHASSDTYQFGDTESFFAGFTFSGAVGLSTSLHIGGNLDVALAGNVNVAVGANIDFSLAGSYTMSAGPTFEKTDKEHTTSANKKITLQVNQSDSALVKAAKIGTGAGAAALAAGVTGLIVGGAAAAAATGTDDSVSEDKGSTWGSRIGIGAAAAIWGGSIAGAIAHAIATKASSKTTAASVIEMETGKITLAAGPSALPTTPKIEIGVDSIKLSISPTCYLEISQETITLKSGTNSFQVDPMGMAAFMSDIQLSSKGGITVKSLPGQFNVNSGAVTG